MDDACNHFPFYTLHHSDKTTESAFLSNMTGISGGRHDDGWRSFQKQFVECWVGEAIAHVAERAVASAHVDCAVLLSIDDGSHPSTNLSSFALHFEQLGRSRRERDALDRAVHRSVVTSEVVTGASAFSVWFASHRKQLQMDARDASLVVLVAPTLSALDEQEIQRIVEQSNRAAEDQETHRFTLLLVIRDPVGLVDVDNCLSTPLSRSYELVGPHELTLEARVALVRPLKQLGSQVGLRLVMEIARQTVFQADCESSSRAGSGGGSSSSRPKLPMLASVAHMPFQLLLQMLRWSHFHPVILQAVAKPFERKLCLIPQARIRDAIARLRDEELAIWSRVDACAPVPAAVGLLIDCEPVLSGLGLSLPIDDSAHADQRGLSECQLWDIQKQFYVAQGIHAWSDGIVPFGVSSSSFLAAVYART